MSNVQTDAPHWFTAAVAAPVDIGRVDVAGAEVHYRAWGPTGAPGLVLVHGGAAHSRWWDHVAPMLAAGRRVVALDLTGHGDSDRRPEYGLERWAEEALAVAKPAGISGAPVLVGHSMGGMVSYVAAQLFGEDLAGVQLIDSPVLARTPEEEEARKQRAFGPKKVYPSREVALERFRFVPPQDTVVPAVLRHVAETSMEEVDGGWSWKFDSSFFAREGSGHLGASDPRCRLAYFRAENGIVTDEMMDSMRSRFGPTAVVVEIPDAGHHVMIDQPLALVVGIRTVLASWDVEDSVTGMPR
ncbi:alpha/beta fold hydrolase [Rhodococcus sp. T7]|uniref:alpha/beta fold hydrolase n=1 Tax=Rhodococcus sp. T7 TaxID=627444 RepID=UPI001358A643|nr:alpha/beta hydrolase [Rhodococcus sp. T7]KAF0958435.1 2-succinyl-6-hydroxy-2,4-cyclohexadiene-1-carboxylate synthase [Rhodococcus sp. T7]